MKTEITTITPEIAADMMTRSKEAGALNRLTKSKVAKLARQLKKGLWRLNGEPIITSETGKIIDGHHRLEACRMTKVAIETVLVSETPEDILDTIDTGASRSIADTLHLAGHHAKPGLLGALGKAVGYLINSQREGHPLKNAQPPACEISEWLHQHSDLETKCLSVIERTSKVLPAAPKSLVAYSYLEAMTSAEPALIDQFFERVISGFGITAGDPAGAMRELFLVEVPAKNKSKRPFGNVEMCARILKAINASIHGERLQKLTWSARKEEFPIIGPGLHLEPKPAPEATVPTDESHEESVPQTSTSVEASI